MIYSVNVKHNMMFGILKDFFNLTAEQLSNEVLTYFDQFINIIGKTKIRYNELANCLIPSKHKKEICLVFDTLKITNSCYGREIFNKILPLFNKNKTYNVLYGDLLDYTNNKSTDKILDLMCKSCNILRVDEHKCTDRYFLVYINNLSKTDFECFSNLNNIIDSFVGFSDMTNSSLFKSYISNCISSGFIIYKNIVICGHEPDIEDVSDRNMPGFNFNENGFNITSISSDYYSVFLNYLIDSSISIWKTDRNYKKLLSEIISNDCNLENFDIMLTDEKFNYLISKKNIDNYFNNVNDLKQEILSAIKTCFKNNIFYKFDFSKLEYKVILFTVFIDMNNRKIACGIKYNIKSKKFEVTTMF